MFMFYCRILLFTLISLSFQVHAQEVQRLNAAEIKLSLQKLNVVGNVLYIAAHPDDENTRLLAYMAKERKFRTGYLSITRGDGGQNLIGKEQAELLGLIRTQELLAARKIDGAEQFFTRANDFGFSKSSEESLNFWGKESTLADVVWTIRNFKPDVIITRFPEDARAGHGQHAASAILAREAFSAAANPNRFMEQLKYVNPWQAKRILWNKYNFSGNAMDTAPDDVKVNVGLFNSLLGKSYGEISAESRTKHKSQGFGTAAQRGEFIEYFSHVAGTPAKSNLFEGINTSWTKEAGSGKISALITQIEKGFDSNNPWKSVNGLLQIKSLIDQTNNPTKAAEINDLIIACTGLWFEITSKEPQYAMGDSIPVKVEAIYHAPADFPLKISISETLSGKNLRLLPNKLESINTKVKLPDVKLSNPYWLDEDHGMGAYVVKDQTSIGLPENKSAFSGNFVITIGDQTLPVRRPIAFKSTDPVKGEVYQPLVVAPPVTATFSENAYLFASNQPKKIAVQLQSFRDNSIGSLSLRLPAGWNSIPKHLDFNLKKKGNLQNLEFTITPGEKATDGNLEAIATINGKTFNKVIKEIRYDHIPAQTLFPKAEARLKKIDLKAAGRNIAYITGAGDLVMESLKEIGYQITILSPEQALNSPLQSFDAIITGIRFYNVNKQSKLIQPKLLEYVKNGGTLLVQYNINSGLQVENIGPSPFSLSRDRVTEEDAKVSILAPQHPVLNYPNKITPHDFEGWVQERGLYFASEIDKAYTPILSTSDKGEKNNTGGLLVADYGKGRFVYTSLSFFRQLPAGVPGAYRLFVNLISKER
jgi:LmbE family N-acetylglucosaminyl deacetylase